MPVFGPIEQEPRRVRPPYDVPDRDVWHNRPGESTDAWRARLRADRLAALLDPLDGIDVSRYERHTLVWLCGWEDNLAAVLAALLHRARAARPLPAGRGHPPARGGGR